MVDFIFICFIILIDKHINYVNLYGRRKTICNFNKISIYCIYKAYISVRPDVDSYKTDRRSRIWKNKHRERTLSRAILCICLIALAAGGTVLLLFWLGVSRTPKKSEELDGVEIESYIEYGENASIAVHYPKTDATPSTCRYCVI